MPSGPAFLFDLDGTLVDSVYQHVLAWREALESVGIELSVWRIHRRIGMSGGLFVNALFRETGRELKPEQAAQIRRAHADAYARQVSQVRPLPGARELLDYLTKSRSEEHTSELQSQSNLVCRLLLGTLAQKAAQVGKKHFANNQSPRALSRPPQP